MAEPDAKRSAISVSSSSSESSESIDSEPERRPLILSKTDSKASNYQSTTTQNGVETEEDGSRLEEEPTSKSTLAIISLLLIGNYVVNF
jgi:hypothetical protein